MSCKWLDTYTSNPDEPGWYPVLVTWDSHDGAFPNGDYWDGEKWSHNRAALYLAQKCANEEEANELAHKNDPDLD